MNKLIEMKGVLYDTPHLINVDAFDWVEKVVNAQEFEFVKKDKAVDRKQKKRSVSYNEDTKMGMLSIEGPLTYKEYEAMCGETNASYQQLEAEFDTLLSNGAKEILLDVNSPGGQAYGMMELGKYMRKKADEKKVKLTAYVDGLAASAGYGLASSAHEIVVNPEAEVGSIGVVVKLRNANGMMKDMGVKDTYVYAGKSKIPFDAEGEFTQDFLSDIQEKVDALYEQFTSYVADMRSISVDAVKATEAKTFLASRAVELGLADKIMTREEFFNYLADEARKEDKMLGKLFNKDGDEAEMAKLEELSTKLEEMTAMLADKETALSAALANAEAALTELSEVKAKLATAEAEKAEAAAKVKAAKDATRLSAIKAVVPQEEAAAKLFNTFNMIEDDAAFEEAVNALRTASRAAEVAEMTEEVGVGGQGEPVAKNAVRTKLEQIYKKA